MKGCLRIVRGNEVKLVLPGPSITVKPNGTLWMGINPILGITNAAEKSRVADLVRAKKYDHIPDEYFIRLGDNPDGLWAGTDEAWAKHPQKAKQEHLEALKVKEAAKQVRIYLSSCGWGDYSSCEWRGDITRPDAEIMEECKKLLGGHDVDQPNQSDEEIMGKIEATRRNWETAPARKAAQEAAEAENIRRKIETGYCFTCETWCHGDCGHYSNNPHVMYHRRFNDAAREANYGIND